MARIPLFVLGLTAGAVLAVSPIASATNNDPAPLPAPTQQPPAMSANMLPLSMCGKRDQVVNELSKQYDESPMAVGMVDRNAVVEIFVSETGSWTILATGTDGMSCIVSAGEGFESTTRVRGMDA
jgi:hypothetical protein